ncbi:unnamed protein product [Ilex paraguariensis]|uniref:Scarecrow-like protein 8 n=1 Tax=Ilex paraguariensis TaxID=185542 RepID=A0ABC8UWI0_9AQUA
MSSGFSGAGVPDFYTAGGRSVLPMRNPLVPYRSPLAGMLPDQASQIIHRRSDVIGKRSLTEFQQQHQFQQLQQQGLGLYLRNVKPRTYQHTSPISPLSPVDFAASLSSEASSLSSSSSAPMSTRHGFPIIPQLQPQPITNFGNGNNSMIPSSTNNFSSVSFPNSVQNQVMGQELLGQESEKKMMNRLQELEKQLLDDNDDESGGTVSVVTNSEWSETIQSLISPSQKPISPSPTSSSSSCSSSSASPPVTCPKQSITEAAEAISEGKIDVAVDILTRLNQVSNVRGTSKQRLTAYMVSALRSRVNPTEYPPSVAQLYSEEHMVSTQMLYDVSPCFKLGFMAANLAILESTSDQTRNKLHVVDFEIGQGGQYVHLLQALAARKADKPSLLKITTFVDYVNGSEDRLKTVGKGLNSLASKVGVGLTFNVLNFKVSDLSSEALGVENDEVLAVNFAFRLYKLPDESVTTENLRDGLLRRVKSLSPAVVTVVEQEMNANTAPFVARVTEVCGYYEALFDSFDATVLMDNSDRVKIEEGLSRKMVNSVACEGRDRVERCEVLGKWRARMSMAGFQAKPMSQLVAESLHSELNSGPRGNPRFTVKEQTAGICFGWMGRTLTVASAWR